MSVAGIAFLVLIVVAFVAILVDVFRHRLEIRGAPRLALPWVALIASVVGWSLVTMLASGRVLEFFFASWMLLIGLVSAFVYVAEGIYSCAVLERVDLPWTRRWMGLPGREPAGSWRTGLAWTGVLVAGAVLHSLLLFVATRPKASDDLRRILEETGARDASWWNAALSSLVVVIAPAVAEEIVFRLGIQSFVARLLRMRPGAAPISIVASAALWALGHARTLEPEWVKLAQIFPIGLGLGLLFRRWGIELSMLAHATFNALMIAASGLGFAPT